MFHDGGFGMGGMGGMFGAWWLFWLLLIGVIAVVAWGRRRQRRDTPHEVLQRRLASGELTPEDYEKRKALLDRDAPGSKG
jgi:putative membrane protein